MSSEDVERDYFKMEKRAKRIATQTEMLHAQYQITIQKQIETIKNLEAQLETQQNDNFALAGENLRLKVNYETLATELEDRKLTCHILIGRAFKARLENESLKKELSMMRLKRHKSFH